jgi:cytidylate kinase
MAIVTISRGSYSKGKEVAEKVANRLGYQCLSRDIILQASEHFNIPEMKLVRAIHDAPSILSNFTHGKEKYISYVKATLLRAFCRDNIVYHGLAGHVFVKGVPHVLKVRIISDMEDRVRLEMDREGISRKGASRILEKDDEERRKWSKNLYGIDSRDPSLYDLVIHIREITTDDAANLIYETALLDAFQASEDSQNKICDLALSAEAKTAVVDEFPNAETSAKEGIVLVEVEAPVIQEDMITEKIMKACQKVVDAKEIRVHVIPFSLSATRRM